MEDTFPREASKAEILRWLTGNSDLNPDAVVTMTDELVVAITDRADGRGVGRSTRLSLREEIVNPDAAAAWGGRSIQLDLDLDCSRHRVILGARRIYTRPNLQGSVRITRSDNNWAEVPADTVIDDVARAACAPPTRTQLAVAPPASDVATVASTQPAPVQTAAAAVPVAAPALQATDAPSPAVPSPVQVAAAEPGRVTGAPVLDTATVASPPRMQTADIGPTASPPVSAPPPGPASAPVETAAAESVQVAAAEPSPALAAAGTTSVAIAAPSGAGVVVVATEPAPAPELRRATADPSLMIHNPFAEPAAPAARSPGLQRARPAPVAPQRPADYAVQIAAVASADLARDSWQSLKAKLPHLVGPRTFAVEPVSANGRTLYRALLLGFASPNEAAELCKTLRSQSIDCILRQMK